MSSTFFLRNFNNATINKVTLNNFFRRAMFQIYPNWFLVMVHLVSGVRGVSQERSVSTETKGTGKRNMKITSDLRHTVSEGDNVNLK